MGTGFFWGMECSGAGERCWLHTPPNVLETTGLYSLKWLIAHCVNFIPMIFLKKTQMAHPERAPLPPDSAVPAPPHPRGSLLPHRTARGLPDRPASSLHSLQVPVFLRPILPLTPTWGTFTARSRNTPRHTGEGEERRGHVDGSHHFCRKVSKSARCPCSFSRRMAAPGTPPYLPRFNSSQRNGVLSLPLELRVSHLKGKRPPL